METYCEWCHQGDHSVPLPAVPSLQNALKSPRCPKCQRGIALISITTASQVVNVSRKTIYLWIEKGLVSTVRIAGGRQLVCFSSLFSKSDRKDSADYPSDPFEKIV